MLGKAGKALICSVSSLPRGRARACPGPRQMWTEGSGFSPDTPFCKCAFYLLRELGKARFGFNAYPKNSCRSGSGKKAGTAERNVKARHRNRAQSVFDLLYSGIRLFPDELQCNVQRLRTDPAHVWRISPNLVHESPNLLADVLREVESDKDAHGNTRSSIANPSQARRKHLSYRVEQSPSAGFCSFYF